MRSQEKEWLDLSYLPDPYWLGSFEYGNPFWGEKMSREVRHSHSSELRETIEEVNEAREKTEWA